MLLYFITLYCKYETHVYMKSYSEVRVHCTSLSESDTSMNSTSKIKSSETKNARRTGMNNL